MPSAPYTSAYHRFWPIGGGKIQVIVVDDGSTDHTKEILERHFGSDPRVIIVSQANAGVGAARESALKHVAGDCIAFCDSDDWVEPDWLESMYAVMQKYNADIVRFGAIIEGHNRVSDMNDVTVWSRAEAQEQFLIHQKLNGTLWTNLYRRSCFSNIHFDTALTCFEDDDVMWRLLQQVNKVVRVKAAKYHWTIGQDSLSNGTPSVGRLQSCLLFLSKLMASSCIKEDKRLMALAKHLHTNWTLGTLKSMYGCHIHDKKLESDILTHLRRNIIAGVKDADGIVNKAIYMSAVLAPSVARYLYVKAKGLRQET